MRLLAIALALLLVVPPAWAQGVPRPIGQVPLLPLAPGPHEDIDALVRSYFAAYYRGKGEYAFDAGHLRAGRFDLDGDGKTELFVLVENDDFADDKGKPLLVATWNRKGWVLVGWSWGDEDTVFVTEERRNGWRTVDTGTQLLRWYNASYQRVEKD